MNDRSGGKLDTPMQILDKLLKLTLLSFQSCLTYPSVSIAFVISIALF